MGDGVGFAKVIKKIGKGGALASNCGWSEFAALKVLAPGDYVCSGYRAEFLRLLDSDKGRKFSIILL